MDATVAGAGIAVAVGVLVVRRFASKRKVDGENEIVGWTLSVRRRSTSWSIVELVTVSAARAPGNVTSSKVGATE